eukprot:CAMPEP_0118933078 /NCGR_PEP_ID=MMETSP1169-20130426/11234_1 /TAXON_ID=36882 /ORGANISM="Pyramimonas obovata, Strain CCMP722" /LENGTH=47 /DNA_ID= /DNA_START= /DNA_END= /DNA_ORIENTATION=
MIETPGTAPEVPTSCETYVITPLAPTSHSGLTLSVKVALSIPMSYAG